MTEDDTFNVLRRTPFHQVEKEFRKIASCSYATEDILSELSDIGEDWAFSLQVKLVDFLNSQNWEDYEFVDYATKLTMSYE
jgi:hypothetical protein